MKIYIDFEKQAIVKITTEDLFEGDIDSNKFIVLFSNYGTNTNWYPTLTQLAPNGREAGPFNADALEDDATHEYTEDDTTYLKYEWTITNEYALQNGRSNFFIYVNTIKNGGLAKKVYAKFTCVLNESDNQYFVADPEFNPKVKQYIDTYSQLRFDGVGTEAQIEALTENKGIWLCMDDTSDYNGYFFYWDDATEQYVPGNVFQATEVADGAITWAKLATAVQAIINAKAEQTDVTQTITAHEIKTDLVSPKTATSELKLGSMYANISIRENDENTTYVNIFSDYNTYVSGNGQLILESDNDVKIRVLNDNTKIELTENNVNITAPTTTIGKPSKGKIQVGDDIKFIADGSSQMASVDDDGFHAGDFVIAYDTIKSENASFDIESANGDTKIHIDDDEVDISTPTENINLLDKEIEIKIDGTRNQTITLAEDSGNEGSLKSEIQNDTGQSSLFEQYSYGIKFHLYDDGSETDDALIELYDDGVYWNNNRLATEHQVNDEATIRFNADNNLQSQIDGLNAGQNLADIVADLTALNNLSIVNLKNGDKVQVLVDSDHDNESTVYSLSISGSSHTWHYIGMYGKSSYTKAEEDVKFAQIHDILALKEGIDNKVTSLSSSSTNQQYPSAKCVYDALVLKADLTNSYQVITADKVKVNEIRDLNNNPIYDMKPITYSALATLKSNNGLVAGTYYRITDYVTKVNGKVNNVSDIARSMEHAFDIIVLATSTNTFSEEASAVLHSGDTYFANNSNLKAWKLWYCFENDTTRFEWADSANGKGVIYRMIDEFENDLPYDFKNIQFKRYKITATSYSAQSGLVGMYLGFDGTYGATSDTTDFEWYYTFSNRSDGSDLSLTADENTSYNNSYYVKQVKMEQYLCDSPNYRGVQALNNIVMITSNVVIDMTFGASSHHDTLVGNADITYSYYGSMFRNNILIGEQSHNNCGECFENNIIGDGTLTKDVSHNRTQCHFMQNKIVSFYGNTFNVDCYGNIIGNQFYGNVIGMNFISNTIGDNFIYNTIGNDFNNNTIGNNSERNVIGNSFFNNSIANLSRNSIGNYCHHNTTTRYISECNISHQFKYNTINAGFGNNVIASGFQQNNIGGNYFESNVIMGSFERNTTSASFSGYRLLGSHNGETITSSSFASIDMLLTDGEMTTLISEVFD